MKHAKPYIVAFATACIMLLLYLFAVPDYRDYNSYSTSSDSRRETVKKVIVYKARYNPMLYTEIAQKHTKLNGSLNKLTLELYTSELAIAKGHEPYRTVVFDYDDGVIYLPLYYMTAL